MEKIFSGKFSRIAGRHSFRKLTAAALAFLFIAAPLAPLFAAENNALDNNNSSAVIADQPVKNSSNSSAIEGIPANSSNALLENLSGKEKVVDLAAPEKSDLKDKTKEKTGGADPVQTLSDSEPAPGSIPESAKTIEKTKLPQSDNKTGSLTYEYPIIVPSGRNGLQPDLKLVYNSQAGEEGSIIGFGWSINIPYIERINKKGTDKLYTENYFSSSLSGELVNVGGISYSAKVETGEFLKYEYSNNSWIVTDKQGIKYKFGASVVSRQDDPNDASRIFKWMLEEVRDTNDNFIRYEYFKDAGQIYPSKIFYTGNGTTDGIFEVEILREATTGSIVSYKAGFSVKSNFRINEIQAKISGSWVKKYFLIYVLGNNSGRSMLKNITESGIDEQGAVLTLPATSFEYQAINRNWTQDSSWNIPLPFFDTPDSSASTQSTRIADVNGDGLPDLLKSVISSSTLLPDGTNQENNTTEAYLNNGYGWTFDASWYIPMAFYYNDAGSRQTIGQAVQIADINGDGLPDLFRSLSNGLSVCYGTCINISGGSKVYLNNGHGWTQDSSWNIPLPFFDTPDSSSLQAIRIADINGDGLPDLLKSVFNHSTQLPDGTYQEINDTQTYLNNGTGWTLDSSWSIPMAFYYNDAGNIQSIGQTVQLADINGDGLPDIFRSLQNMMWICSGTCQAITGGSKVYLNNGHGWTQDSSWNIPLPFFDSPDNNSLQAIRIADINGDGLPDLLKSVINSTTTLPDGTYQENNATQVYLNNGAGWTLDSSWYIPMAFYYNDAFTNPRQTIGQAVQIADINGDGLPDIFRSLQNGLSICFGNCLNISGGSKVYLNNGRKSDLLTRITYSTGGKTEITYKTTPLYSSGTGLANPNLPFILDTVEKIITDDGLGNISQTTYSYEGGKYYFDAANPFDRKFAGFAKITRTDPAGNAVKTYYQQGDATNSVQGEFSDHVSKIGKIYRTEIYDNTGNLYSKTINKWENYDLGNNQNFVKLIQKINSSYDGNATHKDKAETYAFDNANGNLTGKIQWGEVSGFDDGTFADIGTDKLTVAISYSSNAAANILGLVSQEIITDQSGAKIKESKYYYDNLALGSADKGNLTKEEKWKSGAEYISAEKSYNSYGLIIQETDPRGKTTSYAYDSYNLYPVTVTNALNQSTQYIYDYSAGKVKQIIDPNNFTFQTVYDGLDRVIEEKQPDLITPSILVTKSSYVYTDTANAVSVKKTDYLDAITGVDSYSYFDGLGRIIQTRQEAEEANNFSVKDSVYNNRGLLEKESLPYFDSGTAKISATMDNTLYSVYNYDSLGRVIATTNAVGTITNIYDDWKVTATDARGNAKDLYKDAYGNLIQVNEHNGASIYTTIYNYDGAGNLVKITDALGNIRNFTYDGLGRRLSAEDLHGASDAIFGIWTYTYDAGGNLTSRLDPKNQTVNFTYDDLNRQLTEDFTGATGTEKTYTYDTCVNGIGRLCLINNISTIETKEYNPLGLASKDTESVYAGETDITGDGRMEHPDFNRDGVINIFDLVMLRNFIGKICIGSNCGVDDNGDGLIEYYPDLNHDNAVTSADFSLLRTIFGRTYPRTVFSTSYSYDYLGNIIAIVNPDNSQIKNIYNSAGQLEQTQRKEATDTDFINVIADFDYSPLGKIAYQADANGSETTNTYDAAKLYRLSSKVTVINGGARAQDLAYFYDANGNITRIVDNSATNSKKTADYTYDSLNRLLTATATGAVNDQNYAEAYSYDAIGNITSKNGQMYSYSGAGYANPHAVTSIGSDNYAYDNNGNLLSAGTELYKWTYDNKLLKSASGTVTVFYYYDSTGQRVMYFNGGATTVYPSKFYNTDGTAPTKHIFANDQLVATIKGTGASAQVYAVATDHLTGSNLVTNSAGAIEEVADYYPYGEIRLDEKTGSFSEQRKFAGHELDTDTGLSYMNARYYDSAIGRFMSQDPAYLLIGDQRFKDKYQRTLEMHLSDPQSLNSYSYVNNNPLKWTDPDGEILPFLALAGAAAWAIAEVSLSAYDAYDTATTLSNPNASFTDKGLSAGGFVAGLVLPGGGYGVGAKGVLNKIDDAAKVISNIRSEEKYISKVDDLISPARQNHILNGDATGGGHKFGAGKNKPEFPSSWSNKQTFHNILDIATDPNITWKPNLTWRGRYDRFIADGVRDNINIRAIIEPKGEGIISGFPLVNKK